MSNAVETHPVLQARDLHKHYRMGSQDLAVLRGVDLEVPRGQWLAVLGASGSGKSTLLHLLGGLDHPDRGSVQFDGTEIFRLHGSALDRYRNSHVGFVFQFYHLLPELNCLENALVAAMIGCPIGSWPGRRHEATERATELLGRLGLSERLRHKPNKLSGGERQRLAIARALINQPAVLLADEPTGNLDADTGRQILDVLAQFNRAGQTIIMVTHDPNVARVAHRRLTLSRGRLDGEA